MSRLPLLLAVLVACAPTPEGQQTQTTVAPFRVALTDAEAAAVLALANSATSDTLTLEVGLDMEEVAAIVDGRPFVQLDLLEGAENVDGFTITALLSYAIDQGIFGAEAVDCEPGTVQLSDGRVFSDFNSEEIDLAPGEVLTLCDGYFESEYGMWLEDVTLRGMGEVTIVTSYAYLLGSTRLENLTLVASSMTVERSDNVRPNPVVQDAVLSTRTVRVQHGSFTMRNSRIENTEDLSEYSRHADVGLIVSEGGHAALFDSTVENFPSRFSAVTIEATASIEMVGGGILGNSEGLAFKGDEASFEGVDFGIGAADNALYDIRVERGPSWTSYWYLNQDVTGVCSGYSCVFEEPDAE